MYQAESDPDVRSVLAQFLSEVPGEAGLDTSNLGYLEGPYLTLIEGERDETRSNVFVRALDHLYIAVRPTMTSRIAALLDGSASCSMLDARIDLAANVIAEVGDQSLVEKVIGLSSGGCKKVVDIALIRNGGPLRSANEKAVDALFFSMLDKSLDEGGGKVARLIMNFYTQRRAAIDELMPRLLRALRVPDILTRGDAILFLEQLSAVDRKRLPYDHWLATCSSATESREVEGATKEEVKGWEAAQEAARVYWEQWWKLRGQSTSSPTQGE
jgi:hypothetical protein